MKSKGVNKRITYKGSETISPESMTGRAGGAG